MDNMIKLVGKPNKNTEVFMSVATIICSLIILIIIQRITKNIILAILGAVGTIILFRFDLHALVNAFVFPLMDPDLYKLLGTVFFIYLFSSALDISGDAKRFATSSKALFDDRTSMAFMPMMIGFLPMPGGAMFTAPIVKMIGDDEGFSNDYMMVVNYWFRHVVELFWPVYPAFYILTALVGIELAPFSISLIPIFLIATLSGWILFNGFRLPKVKKTTSKELKGLWIVFFVVLTGIMILVFNMEGYIALGINIGGYFLFRKRCFIESLVKAFKKWDVFLLLFLFFVYKYYLTEVNLTGDIAVELDRIGLNIHLLTIILPLLIGMSTGITQSAVGITAPLLITLGANPAMMYFAAVAGVLLSPVHLCIVLTGNFYKSDLMKVFLKILPLLFITGLSVYLLLVI
jgi:integral membrane protein (TIGR00529 family)